MEWQNARDPKFSSVKQTQSEGTCLVDLAHNVMSDL